MLRFFLKSSARNITRNKLFAALNITGLGIGLAVFILALEYYSYEKGFNNFHTQLKSLYRVTTVGRDGHFATTTAPLAPLLEKALPGVTHAVRFADNFNDNAVISVQDNNGQTIKSFKEEGCVFVDSSFLDVFSFPLLAGSKDLYNVKTTIVTAATAIKLFGTPQAAIGKVIQLHNQFGILPVTVSGVLADISSQSDIQFTCLLPISILDNPGYTEGADWAKLTNWGNDSYTTYLLLNDKANSEAVEKAATRLWQINDPNYKSEKGMVHLQPLTTMHMGADLQDKSPAYTSLQLTYFILGLGILLLCIAWINYINFSTAYAIKQAKQIGIHKVAGSSRLQIIIRYVAEALLLNLAGICLAFFLVQLLQPLFNYATSKPLGVKYINDPTALVFAIGIVIIGVTLCGGYVGFVLAGFKPVTMMRFNKTNTLGGTLLRKGLVVFQFCVSAVFIASTIIAYRQIKFMQRHDLGMDINDLVVVKGPAIRDSSFKRSQVAFGEEVRRLPFVQQLSYDGSVPGIGFAHNFSADGITGSNGQKGDEQKSYFMSAVDENFFPLYKIPLQSGSNFTAMDASKGYDGDELIVNQTAARQLGYQPSMATGKIISWGKKYTIKAVVKDYHHRSLKERIEPIIFIPQHNNANYSIKMSTVNLQKNMEPIRSLFAKLYPGNPFEYVVLKENFDALYSDEQKAGTIALSIAILVIVIACLGLIGLSLFTARRKMKEISIRKVLGASLYSLFMQISIEFMWLSAIAFIISVPLTVLGISKWLEVFPYRIRIPFSVFGITAFFMIAVTILTVSYQALKASMANPAVTLKSE